MLNKASAIVDISGAGLHSVLSYIPKILHSGDK
jgi:hypothetical protein